MGNRAGRMSRIVKVETNDRATPVAQLEGVAEVKSAVRLNPSTVNFGQFSRRAEAQTKTIELSRGDAGPIKPSVVSTGNPQFEAEIKEIEAGEKYELIVTAKPPWPNDMLRGTLVIDTGVTRSPKEQVTLFARITPRLTATPSRLRVPFDPPQDVEVPALLRWSDGPPGNVLEAAVNDPGLRVEVDTQEDKQRIVLHVPAGFKSMQTKRYMVTVKTDDPIVGTLEVPIFASRAPAPTPTVHPVRPPAGTEQAPRPPIQPSADAERAPGTAQAPADKPAGN